MCCYEQSAKADRAKVREFESKRISDFRPPLLVWGCQPARTTRVDIPDSLVSVLTAKPSVSKKAGFFWVLTWHPKTRFPYTTNSFTIFSKKNTISPISGVSTFNFLGLARCLHTFDFVTTPLFDQNCRFLPAGAPAAPKQCRFSSRNCRIDRVILAITSTLLHNG